MNKEVAYNMGMSTFSFITSLMLLSTVLVQCPTAAAGTEGVALSWLWSCDLA